MYPSALLAALTYKECSTLTKEDTITECETSAATNEMEVAIVLAKDYGSDRTLSPKWIVG